MNFKRGNVNKCIIYAEYKKKSKLQRTSIYLKLFTDKGR